MHTYKLLTGATLSLMLAVNAQAAETTDLAIAGTIIPAACTASFSGGGEIDWGNVNSNEIEWGVNKDTQLGIKEITLNIDCESPTRIGIKTTDNKKDSVISGVRLQLYDVLYELHPRQMLGFGLSLMAKKLALMQIYSKLTHIRTGTLQ